MSYSARFRDLLLDSDAWEATGCQLLDSARLLRPKVDEFFARLGSEFPAGQSWRGWADEFVAVYFMLSAFAIENFLKARIIRLNLDRLRVEVDETQSLPEELRTHDLCLLAAKAGMPGVASGYGYAEMLKRLERSATWYGRYPVPLRSKELTPFRESSDGVPLDLSAYSSEDMTEIERILNEVRPAELS